MKKLLLILLLISKVSYSFDWEASIREDFITPYAQKFSGDTAARVFRDIAERGSDSITLNIRYSYTGDKNSVIVLPKYKTDYDGYVGTIARIHHLEKKVILKPEIFETNELGTGEFSKKISPLRPEATLASYDQLISTILRLSRENMVDEVVLFSGISHLMSEPKLQLKFISIIEKAKKQIGKSTNLTLALVGLNDLEVLINIFEKKTELSKTLISSFQKVTYSPLPGEMYKEDITLKENFVLDIKNAYHFVKNNFGNISFGISSLWVPGCVEVSFNYREIACGGNAVSGEIVDKRFLNIKNTLLKLENDGFDISSVDILEATTDFEPKKIELKFFYQTKSSQSKELKFLESKNKPLYTEEPIFLKKAQASNKACVIYDQMNLPEKPDTLGEIHALMLKTLIGAFPSYETELFSALELKKGFSESCDVIFYLATHFALKLQNFILDEIAHFSTQKKLVWFNYKFNDLYSKLQNLSFDVPYILQADTIPSPTNQDPGFFKDFNYKGEVFSKIAQWNPLSNNFAANPELGWVKIINKENVTIYSTATHSKDKEKETPYIVSTKYKNGEIWYVGDSPFSFNHYEDRQFIFADLLWDILEVEAPTKKYALVRMEDVNPTIDPAAFKWAVDYLRDQNIPLALALIPYSADSIGANSKNKLPYFMAINKVPEFMAVLNYAMKRDVDIVLHGVSHMVGRLTSGYDGITGSDYEFWQYPEDKPLPFDSVDWVMNRFDMAEKLLRELKIETNIFEAPHYAASVLDYKLFSKLFDWNWHRSIYFPFKTISSTDLPEEFMFGNCEDDFCREKRKAILRNIEVNADYSKLGGQIVPFIVYKDAYGQKIIPETLGMVDFAFYEPGTWRPVSTPMDIVRRAKKLRVIRGAIASFFWHPQLLERNSRYYIEVPGSYEKMGGKRSLTYIVEELKKLGYEFTSIKNCELFPQKGCP